MGELTLVEDNIIWTLSGPFINILWWKKKKGPELKKWKARIYDQLAGRKAGNSNRHTDDSDIGAKGQEIYIWLVCSRK